MRILVVSQWFPPEPGGGPARFLETGREWARAGHEVHVFSGIPNWPTGNVPLPYSGRRYVRERIDGLDVHRVWVYPARNEGRGKRIVNHASFLASCPLVALATRAPADIVVATSPPIFAAAAGLAIARAKRVPFVLDVRDLWPDAIFALGQMQAPSMRKALRRLESILYSRAEAVVPVSDSFSEPIMRRGGHRVEVIPNGADLESFAPGPAEPDLREELGWNGRFVVMYAGTLGMAHGLMTIVEAASRCPDDEVLFVLVGDGAEREQLEERAVLLGLRNVQILPLQPRSQMPSLYRSADACLVSLRPISLFDGFIPSKIFEIMACGRPILAAVRGQALELVLEARAGVAVRQGSAESLLEGIKTLRGDDAARAALGRHGRRYAELHHDRRRLAERYSGLLQQIVHEESSVDGVAWSSRGNP